VTRPPSVRRIGILGGTFDPIHRGHIDLGEAAETALGLMRVFVVPSHVPPHRPQTSASSFHRFAMAAMTVSGRTSWRVSDIEFRHAAPSYTAATLGMFHERGYNPWELFFIMGADAFADIESWKDYPRLLDAAHFAVVSRPGLSVLGLPERLPMLASRMVRLPRSGDIRLDGVEPLIILIEAQTADVSSTTIRRLRADGESITGLVDLRVQQHIEQHGLYTPMIPGRRGNDDARNPAAGRLHGQG
jgi:nicotinate-nucleotide adenylyltransferase